MQRLYAHGHEAVEVFVRLLGHGRLHGQAAVLGLCFFVSNLVSQWCVFRALGIEVPVLVALVYVSLALRRRFTPQPSSRSEGVTGNV